MKLIGNSFYLFISLEEWLNDSASQEKVLWMQYIVVI